METEYDADFYICSEDEEGNLFFLRIAEPNNVEDYDAQVYIGLHRKDGHFTKYFCWPFQYKGAKTE